MNGLLRFVFTFILSDFQNTSAQVSTVLFFHGNKKVCKLRLSEMGYQKGTGKPSELLQLNLCLLSGR